MAAVGEPAPVCPLCDGAGATRYHEDRTRAYWRCRRCALVFVPPESRVDAAAEKARYDQHQNDPSDARYRAFLARLADPLLKLVPPGAVGLDFGSGPGPTLGPMLREAGLRVFLYDVFYAPDPDVWTRRYDFITATEVAEHLHHPRTDLDRCYAALTPGGVLGVMTKWVTEQPAFAASRYIRDPTHVCFFSRDTCQWIAHRWGSTVEFPAVDIAFFRRGAAAPATTPT
jgi:hypothetical protein